MTPPPPRVEVGQESLGKGGSADGWMGGWGGVGWGVWGLGIVPQHMGYDWGMGIPDPMGIKMSCTNHFDYT